MAFLNTLFQTQNSMNKAKIDDSLLFHFGRREISICKDFRKRFYDTNPFIECRAGVNAGHVEILVLRNWLIIFSKAQHLTH